MSRRALSHLLTALMATIVLMPVNTASYARIPETAGATINELFVHAVRRDCRMRSECGALLGSVNAPPAESRNAAALDQPAEPLPFEGNAASTVRMKAAASPHLEARGATVEGRLTLKAEADARVEEANPRSNFGTHRTLRVVGRTNAGVETYVRFTVGDLTQDVLAARIRLFATTDTVDGPAVYLAPSDWDENTITWATRPPHLHTSLDDLGAVSQSSWVELDVTQAINGNGTYTFVLVSTSPDGLTLSSREGEHPPELVITVPGEVLPTLTPSPTLVPSATPTPSPTPTPPGTVAQVFEADADTRVEEANPSSNFGTHRTLRVVRGEDPAIESYIRFKVSGISPPVVQAWLRMYATSDTADGVTLHAIPGTWVEDTVTWDTRSSYEAVPLAAVAAIAPNTWISFDVTQVISGNGFYSFAVVASSSDGVTFASRETDHAPQLIVVLRQPPTASPSPTPTPSRNPAPPSAFAKLAHKGGAAIEQISLNLGHGSVKTTEIYLGVDLELQNAPSDHIDLRLDIRPQQLEEAKRR